MTTQTTISSIPFFVVGVILNTALLIYWNPLGAVYSPEDVGAIPLMYSILGGFATWVGYISLPDTKLTDAIDPMCERKIDLVYAFLTGFVGCALLGLSLILRTINLIHKIEKLK